MRRFSSFSRVFILLLSAAFLLLGCNGEQPTREQRRGALLYGQMCAVCHGPRGAGYKANQAPAITHPGFLSTVTNEFLRHAIANGRSGTTMSAWSVSRGGPLSTSDINAVIAFLRRWDRRPHPSLDEGPASGDASRGSAIFAQECARCHGTQGIGGANINIGKTELLSTASNGFLRYAIRHGRPGTSMPGFQKSLGNEGIEDVLAFLRTTQFAPTVAANAPASRPPPIPLGPVPLNRTGPEPKGFRAFPATTPADVIKSELDRGARMALLDARAPSDYTNEHIVGAVSVPFYDPEPYVSALPKDAWLVCYCSCPHAESRGLAQSLIAKGFSKVTVLDEGLGYWKGKKYGTNAGLQP